MPSLFSHLLTILSTMNNDTRAAMAAIFNKGKAQVEQVVTRDFAECVKAANDTQIYTDPTPITHPDESLQEYVGNGFKETPPMPEPEKKPALTFPEPVVSKVLTSKGVGELSPADFGNPDTWAAKFACMSANGYTMENLSFDDVNFVSLMQAPVALEYFQIAANYYRELYLKYKALAPKG